MDEGNIEIPPGFQGFNPNENVEVYQRNLPHWRQPGATYFVTFRLADALPQSALRDLKLEEDTFLAARERLQLTGTEFRKATDDFYKRYGQLLDRYLDSGSGNCELKIPEINKIVMDAFRFFDGERYELYAAVVMPNHCHLLVNPFESHPLETVLKSWKGFAARKINKSLQRSGRLWQEDSFDRIIRDEAHFRNAVRYCRKNPQKASLSDSEFAYWESAGRTDF